MAVGNYVAADAGRGRERILCPLSGYASGCRSLGAGIGGYLPTSKVYSFEPLVPEALNEDEQKYILGPQVNLWTEYVAYPQHLFYMLLPRLDAISEVQWCRPDQKDFENFKARFSQSVTVIKTDEGSKVIED